jgi:hypothetical protein
MGATLALATALALGFTACDKDDDKNSDGDLYVPSKDMSNDEILSLFEEVNANMEEVAEVSIEIMGYEGQTLEKEVWQANVSQKKSFSAEYEGNGSSLGAFNYVENFTKYEYTKAGFDHNDKDVKRSYKVTDAGWNNFGISFYYNISLYNLVGDEEGMDDLQWQVEGNTFVASASVTQHSDTIKVTITITTSKKVGSVKREIADNAWEIVKFTYSANPVLPSGFAKSDFPAATGQRSLKVVWGEGQGENTFYTGPDNNSYIYLDEILSHAPRVQGKEVQAFYTNSNFTGTAFFSSNSSQQLQNNNTVLYAKWGSASGSKAAAVKSPERAASKRKFPLGRWLSFSAYQQAKQ